MSQVSTKPTPYLVECPSHGRVYLTVSEYTRQLSLGDEPWTCPLDGREAQFNEENYKQIMGVERK